MSVIYNMPVAEYFAAPGISISTLKHMRPTPAHFQHFLRTEREEPSVEMLMGTLIHRQILEPTAPVGEIAIKDDKVDYRTKAGKEWRAEQQAAGRIILTPEEYEQVAACVGACRESPEVSDLLRQGNAEVSVFSGDKKGRIDFVPQYDPVLVDIKTVRDASPAAFQRSIVDHGWHRQAAWYLDIWNEQEPENHKDGFLWIALEKPTGLLACYLATEAMVAAGRAENEEDWSLYCECKQSGKWPGYNRQVTMVELPKWYNNTKTT